MDPIVLELPTRRATTRLGRALGDAIAPGDLVVLEGGLGAGKTFLVRAAVRALGVPEEVPVASPTFTLMTEYGPDVRARVPLVHADLYRLLGGGDLDDELAELGLRARRGEGWAVVVEWGRDAFDALGGDGVTVAIELSPRDDADRKPTRVARITGRGPRGEALARALAAAFGRV